jgi:hypothetical protein
MSSKVLCIDFCSGGSQECFKLLPTVLHQRVSSLGVERPFELGEVRF